MARLRITDIKLLLASCVMALAGCHQNSGPVPERLAADAAKCYYDLLLSGDAEGFANGLDGTQSASAEYRQVYVDNALRFLHLQDSIHRGIQSVDVDSTSFSDKDSTARVFLRLGYGDRSSERVLMPMLCRKGKWFMR